MADRLRRFLNKIAEEEAYFVGGLIRDILLHRQTRDIDIAYAGDEVLLKQVLSDYSYTESQFHTYKLVLENYNIDIACVREETYTDESDGFPIVTRGSLESDLLRRDFTINTAYSRVNRENIDCILAYLEKKGARPLAINYAHTAFKKHLNNRQLEVLHDRSFIEDPTRLFRVIKYMVTCGFKMTRHTRQLFDQALQLNVLNHLSKDKWRIECFKLLSHPQWAKQLEVMCELGMVERFNPAFLQTAGLSERLIKTQKRLETYDQLCLTTGHLEDKSQISPEIDYKRLVILIVSITDCTFMAYKKTSKALDKLLDGLESMWHYVQQLSHLYDSINDDDLERLIKSDGNKLYKLFQAIPSDILMSLEELPCLEIEGHQFYDILRRIYLDYWQDLTPLINGHDLLTRGAVADKGLGDLIASAFNHQLLLATKGSVVDKETLLNQLEARLYEY